jgi:uncharacterized protein (TIGR00106 family)
MSVLMEFAMFPTSKSDNSSSPYVSRIIAMIRESGYPYRLTPMGTIVETDNIEQALGLVKMSYEQLEPDCDRVYSSIKFDIRKGRVNAMEQKIASVEEKIGNVNK